MSKNPQISRGDFESLLNWLDADSEKAGRKYELIRTRLIKIFYARQCHYCAEELADLTIDRVTAKIKNLSDGYQGEPAAYFYAVAKNVFLEYARKPKHEPLSEFVVKEEKAHEDDENYYDCLDKCLATLSSAHRQLIIQYYQGEKQTKIEERRKLAWLLDISADNLRVRALRIRGSLQKCVLNCVQECSR